MKETARDSYKSPEEVTRRLSGIVNKAINEHPYHSVITITANYTADMRYRTILADCTSGAITITLKTFTGWEGSVSIKKIDASANSVTVDPEGSETIDGNTTIAWATQYDSYTIASNGTNGFIV